MPYEDYKLIFNFLLQKETFHADLLPDGKIQSTATENVFNSPSAWAIHCKRLVNPAKKSGCGWASVSYTVMITVLALHVVYNMLCKTAL